MLKSILVIINLYLYVVRFCLSSNAFVNYLQGFKSPGPLADVYEDSINKQYKFGIPRILMGSKILPLQRKIYSKPNKDQLFWQTVKIWILKSNNMKAAENTYTNFFLPEAQRFLCEDWSCCQNDAHCHVKDNIPRNGDLIVEMLGDQHFVMPFRFLIIWCELAWKIFYRDKENNWDIGIIYDSIKRFCPNPCKSNPCATKLGVYSPDKCQVTGYFVDQYQCVCSPGMEWDKNALLCISLNVCDQSNYDVCDLEGSVKCINSGETGFTCVCKEERMGFDCTQDRNACVENFNVNEYNGNHFCNVKLANKCHPYYGSNFFKCECSDQYTADLSIPFDNCLKQIDSCDFVLCLNKGICTTSPDQTERVCQCPQNQKGQPMFTGLFCELPVGIWSDWSHWTNCRPKCGENRYQLRKRFCLNETVGCDGFTEEIKECEDKLLCPKLKLSGSKKSDIVDYTGLTVMITFVVIQTVGSFFLAQFLIVNREVIFPIILKYCFTPCYKFFKRRI